MKNKRPKKPSPVLVQEKRQWESWEKVFSDSSGKFRVKSFQGNRYYSIFVCSRSGRKLYFAHTKKSHYPLVYLKFCARVGRCQKLLVTDQVGELLSKAMGARLAAQGTHIDPVPKDEHSRNGSNALSMRSIAWLHVVLPTLISLELLWMLLVNTAH